MLTGTQVLAGVPARADARSPLRYPGAKRKILPALASLITTTERPRCLVEPFAGGASVSLGLLEAGLIDRAVLGDLDPLVAAFWRQATTNTEGLIEAMHAEPVTLQRWDHWKAARPRSEHQQAVKALFLNRTSFSGIIGANAGPIGGRQQQSQYTLGCRFNKDALARRLRNVADLAAAGRLQGLAPAGWKQTIDQTGPGAVLYLDPPYVQKSGALYGLGFTAADHAELAEHLAAERRGWVLSYDTDPLVLAAYRGLADVREYAVAHTYSATGRRTKATPGREVIFTNLHAATEQGAMSA